MMRYELTKFFILLGIITGFTFLISTKSGNVDALKILAGDTFSISNSVSQINAPVNSETNAKAVLKKTNVNNVAVDDGAPSDSADPGATEEKAVVAIEDTSNWQKIASDSLGFSVKYPTDILVNQSGDGSIEFAKLGSAQISRSSLTDGMVVTFNTGTYQENNLMQYVQNQASALKDQSYVTDISNINQIEMAGIMGYQYTVSTNEDTSHIYLSNGQNEYLIISVTVKDPLNKGYEDLVYAILSTLDLQISV